jgi:hemerythrin-like domain-containing protein
MPELSAVLPAARVRGVNSARIVAWGQEMRAVHQRLRRALDIARETIEDGGDPDSVARDLRLYCVGFCVALGGHHSSEDAMLFPMVLARRPELAPAVAKLVQDHSMIAHLIRGLEQAISTSADAAALLRHLDGIGAIMESHFRFEERQLVGLLDTIDDESLDKTALFGSIA